MIIAAVSTQKTLSSLEQPLDDTTVPFIDMQLSLELRKITLHLIREEEMNRVESVASVVASDILLVVIQNSDKSIKVDILLFNNICLGEFLFGVISTT